jgi:hypothetical protein
MDRVTADPSTGRTLTGTALWLLKRPEVTSLAVSSSSSNTSRLIRRDNSKHTRDVNARRWSWIIFVESYTFILVE